MELAAGDQLALLVEGDIRALGTVTSAEPGQYAWDQVPVNFPSGLLVNPTSEVRELNAAERQEIWSHVPSPPARRGTLRRTSLLEDRAGKERGRLARMEGSRNRHYRLARTRRPDACSTESEFDKRAAKSR